MRSNLQIPEFAWLFQTSFCATMMDSPIGPLTDQDQVLKTLPTIEKVLNKINWGWGETLFHMHNHASKNI